MESRASRRPSKDRSRERPRSSRNGGDSRDRNSSRYSSRHSGERRRDRSRDSRDRHDRDRSGRDHHRRRSSSRDRRRPRSDSRDRFRRRRRSDSREHRSSHTNGHRNHKSPEPSDTRTSRHRSRSRSHETPRQRSSSLSVVEPVGRYPDFFIVGAQKAGTTSVVANLNKHPETFVANEVHFFDLYYDFGDEWYYSKLKTDKPVIGEKTPELIYCDVCLPRLKEKCPNAKFLLFLREPTSRAFSAWNMETNRGNEELSFSECVERELTHSMGELRTFGSSQVHYIQRGFYMDQIERFLKVFDRSQLLIMVTERMSSDIDAAYRTIFEFLGVPNTQFEKEIEHVGSYKKKIPKRTYQKLRDLYQPHNARLYEFLGGPIGEWEDDGNDK